MTFDGRDFFVCKKRCYGATVWETDSRSKRGLQLQARMYLMALSM
nr:MAG TPA_asm: hypothetical protein [Caudoviricetes sp.]